MTSLKLRISLNLLMTRVGGGAESWAKFKVLLLVSRNVTSCSSPDEANNHPSSTQTCFSAAEFSWRCSPRRRTLSRLRTPWRNRHLTRIKHHHNILTSKLWKEEKEKALITKLIWRKNYVSLIRRYAIRKSLSFSQKPILLGWNLISFVKMTKSTLKVIGFPMLDAGNFPR